MFAGFEAWCNGLKVLITGSSGFIGSKLMDTLAARGEEVVGLERYVTGRIGAPHAHRAVFCDITEPFQVRRLLKAEQPDIVIHLAAISPVSYSYDHPQYVSEVNYLGTVNLAEAAMREVPSLKSFLFASTSEVYGNNGLHVQSEDSPQRPASPYAVSKVAAENYLSFLYEAYGFPVVVARPFNTYGRLNDAHFFIEKCMTQMLRGGDVRLTDPKPVRDWLFVDDHIDGYLALLNKGKSGQTYNLCTGVGFTVRETAEKIAKVTGFKGHVEWSSQPDRPTESMVIIGDNHKAQRELGWTPKIELDEGLRRLVEAGDRLVYEHRAGRVLQADLETEP
jgi:GDP-mannose 4,6-dehydratase